MLITDGRIISNVQDSVLGILTGNLIYQKLKFTVNTNFAISRADEHIDQSIIVYHKLGGIQMLRGAKTISITAMIGIVFTNEHKIYNRSQGRITIDKNFMPILQEIPLDPTNITIPEQLQIELDRTANINQIENPRRIQTNNTLGQRMLRINTPDLNININTAARRSLEIPRRLEMPRRSIDIPIRPESRRGNIVKTENNIFENNADIETNMLAEIPITTSLAQIRPRSRQINLTEQKYYIKLEIKREVIWEEVKAVVDQEISKSFIEEQYTENNLEIDEEGTKTNINIRFNKRDIMSMKIWVEENTDNEHKVTLGSDFLRAVKPYRIQQDRIMININHQTLIIPKC